MRETMPTIIVDTREQRPFEFEAYGAETIRGTLGSGDYGLDGYPGVAIERKSPADLVGCIAGSRERFIRELERLQSLEFSAVVCEGPIDDLLANPVSKVSPQSIIGSVIAWQQRFPRTHWWFMPCRRWAQKLTYLLLRRYWLDQIDPPHKPRKGADHDLATATATAN